MDVTNYVFPNDLHVHWSMMIALYPYITGIVAGAFIVSSLYHVFKVDVLRPISRFSLIVRPGFFGLCHVAAVAASWPSGKKLQHHAHAERLFGHGRFWVYLYPLRYRLAA